MGQQPELNCFIYLLPLSLCNLFCLVCPLLCLCVLLFRLKLICSIILFLTIFIFSSTYLTSNIHSIHLSIIITISTWNIRVTFLPTRLTIPQSTTLAHITIFNSLNYLFFQVFTTLVLQVITILTNINNKNKK